MTQAPTYPTHIIAAAKALAEKHGVPSWAVRDWGHLQAALCEALTTTPPSEEGMPYEIGPDEIRAMNRALRDSTETVGLLNPEPTEDHRRRACEELGVTWQEFTELPRRGILKAVIPYARLLADCERLEAENHRLKVAAEGACYDRDEALAERDAREARVEDKNLHRLAKDLRPFAGKPVGSLRIDMADVRSILALYDAVITAAEPTPDPDLVLAREAAAQAFADKHDWPGGTTCDTIPAMEAAALRALKLKGQAHDQ